MQALEFLNCPAEGARRVRHIGHLFVLPTWVAGNARALDWERWQRILGDVRFGKVGHVPVTFCEQTGRLVVDMQSQGGRETAARNRVRAQNEVPGVHRVAQMLEE